jgi:transposase
MTATVRSLDANALDEILCVSLELGEREWRLTFGVGVGGRVRRRSVAPRDREALLREIAQAKEAMGLPAEARVVSCYEAGRDGFWLHRFLVANGVENLVVDSSSIEVSRRRRRAKTDRLDGESLLDLLQRHLLGGRRKVWSVVRVPTPAQEARRHLHRELLTAKRDRTRVTNRMRGLLANQGLRLELKGDVPARLARLQLWDGSALAPELLDRLVREWEQVVFLTQRIEQLEERRRELVRTSPDADIAKVRQLLALRGIGSNAAWLFVMEFFGWRGLRNRRQVGALAGLAPTPHASGQEERERGIGKDGSRWVRTLAIEIAWGWLRFQPESALAQWYQRRFGHGSKRLRKIGIVALGRRLLVELWRFLETGALPEGAVLKPELRVR